MPGIRLLLACQALLLATGSGCSSMFYYPDRYLYYPPEELALQKKEIEFKSKDGTSLLGWFFPAQGEAPKGMIVQFHGNAQNMSSHYLSLAWLTRRGYNLFAFDYRGYGKSEGKPDQQGTYYDGLAALEQAWELNGKLPVFVVHGQSLGGAIAMRALADFQHRQQVSLIVMDSSFVSYKDVARRVLARSWLTWVLSPLGMVLVSDEFSAEEALKRNQTRLLVIHDQKDPVVPFEAGKEFYGGASCQKEFWVLNKGRHTGAFLNDEPELRKRYLDLLDNLRH